YYKPHRGYLYFKLPAAIPAQAAALKEWADLKAVAGTGQPVMFGSWSSEYVGCAERNCQHSGFVSSTGQEALFLYKQSEKLPPSTYTMDSGIVKLGTQGNHAILAQQLRDSLKR